MTDGTIYHNYIIIGLGLIGGSIAKDIRESLPQAKIYAIEPNIESLEKAKTSGVVNKGIAFNEISNYPNSLIVISTPIELVVSMAKKISYQLENVDSKSGFLVIDVSSVKIKITHEFEKLSRNNVEFLATHPMAGTEFSSYSHARKDLFKAKPWMICPHKKNTETAILLVEKFVKMLGGRIKRMTPIDHDRNAAAVSHLIILLSNFIFDFIVQKHSDALEFAGDGFTSTTRLASGNPELHTSILNSNKSVIDSLYSEFYEYLGDHIENGLNIDPNFFVDNMERRNSWIHKKTK